MREEYMIFTDVSADIDKEFAKEKDIHFIAMNYTLGEEERHCDGIEDEEILKRFYDGQRDGDFTKTSQISPANYMEAWEPYVKEGTSILYLSLSGGLSGTFQSSNLAARDLMEEYEGVSIISVDSLAATGGMGLLAEAAVFNREKGMSIEENAEWLDNNKMRINHWFMVEDLMYLKRGGRVSAATALVGTTLNIKPILTINSEGKLPNIDKKRGVKAALNRLFELYQASSKEAEQEFENTIYLVHADDSMKVEMLKKRIMEANPNAIVKKMMLSPIIGAHVGPGMAAVIHWGQGRTQ